MILKKSYEWTVIAFKSFNLKLQDKELVVVAGFMNNKIMYFKYINKFQGILLFSVNSNIGGFFMSNEEIEEYFSSLKTEVKEKVDFEEKLNALLKKDVKYHPQQLYFDFCQMEICENMKI